MKTVSEAVAFQEWLLSFYSLCSICYLLSLPKPLYTNHSKTAIKFYQAIEKVGADQAGVFVLDVACLLFSALVIFCKNSNGRNGLKECIMVFVRGGKNMVDVREIGYQLLAAFLLGIVVLPATLVYERYRKGDW